MEYKTRAIKGNKFLLFISTLQTHYWFVYLLIVRLSLLWYSLILTYCGNDLKLVHSLENGRKVLTKTGWVGTVIITILVIVGEAAKKYSESLQELPSGSGGFAVLNNLRNGFQRICNSKYQTLLSEIHSIKKGQSIDLNTIPDIISNPIKQLDIISKEMAVCLRYLLREDGDSNWQDDDLYISIAYQFPKENDDWHWATEEHGMCFEELLTPQFDENQSKNIISTFKYLISSKGNVVFFNSKAQAYERGKYIPDDLDEYNNGKLLGSIACYEDVIKKSDVNYIRFILTITTYSRPFASETQFVENIKHNMKTFVIADFFSRIRIELCLLYIEQLKKQLFQ